MRSLSLLGVLMAMAAAPSFGAIIFQDNFDASLPGSQLNAAIGNWSATDGTFDYIKTPNQWGIVCAGGAGGCLDLDGSTGNAVTLEVSSLFNFVQGVSYTLSYDLSGNQRSGNDTVTVTLGGVSQVHNLASNASFSTFSLNFTPVSATTGKVIFTHGGGDNIGMILDNVSLSSERLGASAVPEPSTFAMMGMAAVGLGFWLRGRKS